MMIPNGGIQSEKSKGPNMEPWDTTTGKNVTMKESVFMDYSVCSLMISSQ